MIAPHALLVDMDGTLVDSEGIWLGAETRLMLELGSDWSAEDQMHCLGGPLERVIAYMIGKVGGTHDHDELADRLVDYVRQGLSQSDLGWRQGMLDLLVQARDAEIPCALVTASSRTLVNVVLAQLADLLGWAPFQVTVTGDEVGRSKPDPAPYQTAARRCGVSTEQSLAFEDSPTGVRSAVAAGCGVIAIPHLGDIDVPGAICVPTLDGTTIRGLWNLVRSDRIQDREA
jgi:HAD superfamily hydrolase (TIGR01509 family)